ncbi:TrlF family AAA-like ATPase [Salinivibrio costicola]|uniref:AAA family ATPase n=1 Tax=Salinivibrio costicola TaxID=51367 RepID=A0ABX6K7D3_SALCS|nr:AAA family ATPase [Salinivibrio costicola]QIR07438.1 AAA family ATPase [Salinivibrio costicola]
MTFGSRFHRGDLHIHSCGFGGSYDVTDSQMTPENIIAKAIEKNLSIISITDHNKISNSIDAVNIAEEKEDLLVVPGIEISTTQGHLLAYFPTTQDLENFYGKLNFDPDKKFSTQGIYECLEYVKKYNGFGILAHIEVDSGFELTIGKFNEIFDLAFQHPSILALEIRNHESVNFYTQDDDNPDRKHVMKKRNQILGLPDCYKLAKVMSSDAHSMNAFGKNASGADRLTRFKLDELSFDGLRIALMSHDSRVRLEDDVPIALPRFKEIKASGGILDGMSIELSNNMNCIIGGRGTGKSTLVTAIQEASNNPVDTTAVQRSNAWPSKIELTYENEAGQEFKYVLEHGNLTCIDGDSNEINAQVPLEAYSQGFTAFSSNGDEDDKDKKLLKFFDGFTNVQHLKDEDRSKIVQTSTNFEQLQSLTNEVAEKSNVDKELQELQSKKSAYEKQNVGELMRLHSSLVEEEALRKELEESLGTLSKRYKQVLSDKDEITELLNIDRTKVHVGKDHVDNVLGIVQEFSDIVDRHQKELSEELEQKLIVLRNEVRAWRSKEGTAKQQIEVKKKELDNKKIPYDEGKFITLSNDITRLQQRQKDIQKSANKLKETKTERANLFKERDRISKEIQKHRLEFCTRVNQDLSGSVDGLFVQAKVGVGYLSKEFSTFIKTTTGWHRWANSDKIASSISPLEFYKNMKFKKYDFLSTLGLSEVEIEDIKTKICGLTLEKVLSIPFRERPKLTVTRHNKSQRDADVKDISELSLGQQQSIMLSILIQSDSNLPLIIDQPEDNLDSEFIFNSVVSNLRRCKEKRQIIVVTHNSNIGVLGDAELVIPLVASNDKSSIVGMGSIDNKETQDQCCEILEGGRRAFSIRKEIYRI